MKIYSINHRLYGINVQKCSLCYLIFMARRITSSARSSKSAPGWLLLAVTWQPREGLQTLIYSAGSSESADRVLLLTACDCLPILAALHPSPERMSTRTLPLLFINLGGEMLYILDQRLRAQNIPADKAKKGRWQLICHRADEASNINIVFMVMMYDLSKEAAGLSATAVHN